MTIQNSGGSTGRQIAAGLRAEILAGTLPPGERISQEAVAERYSASRIPVRDGLKLLESEGLITIVPNAGAWVAKLNAEEFSQIYLLREQVEALAIRQSIDGLTPAQIERMRELAAEIEGATEVESFLKLDREFHLLSYAGATFPVLHEMVERFWNSTQQYRRAFATVRTEEQKWATDAEHRLIVNAIERRDYAGAGDIVSSHIRRTRLILESRPDVF